MPLRRDRGEAGYFGYLCLRLRREQILSAPIFGICEAFASLFPHIGADDMDDMIYAGSDKQGA